VENLVAPDIWETTFNM